MLRTMLLALPELSAVVPPLGDWRQKREPQLAEVEFSERFSKHALGEGLYELRGNQVRIFYMFRPGRKVVILDGIVKKQDKIPKDTLRRVRKYRRDVLEKKTGES